MICHTKSASLHQRLKANTTAWHSRLDSTPALRQLIRPELTLEQYVAALRGLMLAHSEVERWLQQITDVYADVCPDDLPAYRPRVPALTADLARLATRIARTSSASDTISSGEAVRQSSSHRSPPLPVERIQLEQQAVPTAAEVCRARSRDEARAHYIGIRYVLEGATQGGKMISKRITTQLPQLQAEEAFAYWRLLDAASAGWTALSQSLARPPQHSSELAAMTAGAEAVYRCFIDAFRPTDPTAREDKAPPQPSSPLRQS